jgi:nucleoside-diphosphate-sugar epimerase
VVLHAASYVGEDEELCRAVNQQGTIALADEARRAGVRHVVYVSTTAVYGRGVHANLAEDACAPQPESPASRSRLEAEHIVRSIGGSVLRAPFVYGAGDRWFIPTLVDLLRRYPQLVEIDVPTQLSVVSIDDLARLLAAMSGIDPERGGLFHASHPQPIRIPELARLVHQLVLELPTDVPQRETATTASGSASSQRHLAMLAEDHWYDPSRIWSLLGLTPGPSMVEAFASQHSAAYRALLA